MKAEKEFINYLTSQFRSEKTSLPYSQKVASDILSRCRRIELLLEIKLSIAFVSHEKNYLALREQIKSHGDFCSEAHPYGYGQYIHALKAYYLFASSDAKKNVQNEP